MSEWSEGYEVGYSNGRDAGERAGLERAAKMLLGAADNMESSSEQHLAVVRAFALAVAAGMRIAGKHYVGSGSLAAVPLPEGETQKLTDGPTLTSEGAT